MNSWSGEHRTNTNDREGGTKMEITIKATPEELAKMLQAIASSPEQRIPIENIVFSSESIKKIVENCSF